MWRARCGSSPTPGASTPQRLLVSPYGYMRAMCPYGYLAT